METSANRYPVSQVANATGNVTLLLPFFPAARPDELLSSRVSRFHIERGNAKTRETYRELFGSSPFHISKLYTSRIDALAARLPGDHQENAKRVIYENTLIPIARLFTASTVGRVGDNDIGKSMRVVGETRVCLQCIEEDTRDYGSAHIHRSHNIPVVTACWKHKTRLLNHCPTCFCPIEVRNDLVLSPLTECICGYRFEASDETSTSDSVSSKDVDLAKFAHDVLNKLPEGIVAEGVPYVLRNRAIELGFRYGKEGLDRRGLMAAMVEHYTHAFLSSVDVAYAKGKTAGWLDFLGLSNESLEGPFNRNLLLANFLFDDADAFLSKVKDVLEINITSTSAQVMPENDQRSSTSVTNDKDNLELLITRLAELASTRRLSIQELWRNHYGAMKRITRLGGKSAVDSLRSAIETNPNFSKKKEVARLVVHPKDLEWAEEIKATACRLYNEPGMPIRITMALLVKHTKCCPSYWPSAERFPLTRAACEASQESQCHFYARRIMWAMANYYGQDVTRAAIPEYSGLECHRANDVYHFLESVGIIPAAPFTDQLESKGISRTWGGPFPNKVYRKTGRGYVKTGVRGAYAVLDFANSDSGGNTVSGNA